MTAREQAEKFLEQLSDDQIPAALEALEEVEREARVIRVLRERNSEKASGR